MLDIVGLWADAQLTACIQSILNLPSIAFGLVVLWADHKVWYKFTLYYIYMRYCTLGIVGLWADVQLTASSHTILIMSFIACGLVGGSQSLI
jgi:hypothetical protein